MSIEEYKKYKELCVNALTKINKVLPVYFNTGSLKNIDTDDLQDIMYDLIDLEVETQGLDSCYGEWSLLWIEALARLRYYEINSAGDNTNK